MPSYKISYHGAPLAERQLLYESIAERQASSNAGTHSLTQAKHDVFALKAAKIDRFLEIFLAITKF